MSNSVHGARNQELTLVLSEREVPTKTGRSCVTQHASHGHGQSPLKKLKKKRPFQGATVDSCMNAPVYGMLDVCSAR
jgi:hypothetical protein